MAYDEGMAARIRARMAGTPGLTEKKMFGGLGFLVNGHLAVSAYKGGDLMIRCAPADWSSLCARPGARTMNRGEKPVSGWVVVDADAVNADDALHAWVDRGRAFAAAQPAK